MLPRNKLSGLAAAIGILVLILDGKTALAAGAEGVAFCIRTVIPSLFPFFVLSDLAISGLSPRWLRRPGAWLKIPQGAESILLAGFLGGYPTGAQCIANEYTQGNLSLQQAKRMVAFCSNAGPSFIFGLIGPMFVNPVYPWLLWVIHILSALTVGFFLPGPSLSSGTSVVIPERTLSASVAKGCRTMALVCGWIILFRILMGFFTRWFLWIFPTEAQVAICGILELSNGCSMLGQIPSEPLRFLICSGILGLGGLCVTMQTASVLGDLSIREYVLGKLAQTGISISLSCAVLSFLSVDMDVSPLLMLIALGTTALAMGFLSGRKIAVAFPGELVYNTANQNKRRDTYAVSQKN